MYRLSNSNEILMPISNSKKKHFRSIGHNLKPIVTIAQKGITENIKKELNRALTEHELVKIKLLTSDRSKKKKLSSEICSELGAECIQSIGHIVLLYRMAKKPDARLSNLIRKTP
jgi:RNA-binding protein|tara:strand:+ start:344 stop:688 length:345 start_codon:yes stop_codon:yes gene_type:complete